MNNNQPMSFGDFLIRAAIWGGLGYIADLRGSRLKGCAFLGPINEQVFGYSLEDIGAALERERKKKEWQERISNIEKNLLATSLQPPKINMPEKPNSILSSFQTPIDNRWLDIIEHPAIVLVLGSKGSGKSAACYRFLELFRYKLTPYVVGFPEQGKGLLPDWIGIAKSLEEVPPKSISLVDEAYLLHHARDRLTTENKNICRLLNLSRQEDKTILFIAQQGRQLDIDIVSSADVLILKTPGMLQSKFERPELRDILIEARQAFESVRGNLKRWSYVYSHNANFAGLLENELPTFWNHKLSNIYGYAKEPAQTKLPNKMTLEEKILKAKELYRSGWSLSQIAKYFGVSKSTVCNWIHDYPY